MILVPDGIELGAGSITTLLAIQTTLVAALVFVLRTLMARAEIVSDRHAKHIESLIESLKQSVQAFDRFEREERKTHKQILDTQTQILEILLRQRGKLQN